MQFHEILSQNKQTAINAKNVKRPVHGRAVLQPVKPTHAPIVNSIEAITGHQMSLPQCKPLPSVPEPDVTSTLETARKKSESPAYLAREFSLLRGQVGVL